MTADKRRAPLAQPTAERTADQSTPSASGLTADRPGVNPERQYDDDQDVVPRTDYGQAVTPRKYEQDDEKVVPSDDTSLNTKI